MPGSFLNEDPSLAEDATPSPTPRPSLVPGSDKQVLLQLLINRAAPERRLVALIEAIFSNGRVSDIVECVKRSDAQTFVDVLDEVCHH